MEEMHALNRFVEICSRRLIPKLSKYFEQIDNGITEEQLQQDIREDLELVLHYKSVMDNAPKIDFSKMQSATEAMLKEIEADLPLLQLHDLRKK